MHYRWSDGYNGSGYRYLECLDMGTRAGSVYTNYGLVHSLIVEPAYRRRGIASQLMTRVVLYHGSNELRLDAGPCRDKPVDLDTLVRFYKRFGFQICQTKDNPWAISMKRPATKLIGASTYDKTHFVPSRVILPDYRDTGLELSYTQ